MFSKLDNYAVAKSLNEAWEYFWNISGQFSAV
jgi:hypothetical protein